MLVFDAVRAYPGRGRPWEGLGERQGRGVALGIIQCFLLGRNRMIDTNRDLSCLCMAVRQIDVIPA